MLFCCNGSQIGEGFKSDVTKAASSYSCWISLSIRDQVCDYLFINLRPLIYTHVKPILFWILKYRNQIFWPAVWFQLGQDWWPQWRSPEQHLPEPVLCKLEIKSSNSSSKKLLSHTDRASPSSAACDAAQERRKSIFLLGRRRPQNMLWCWFLFIIKPIGNAYSTDYPFFNAVFKNIAVLYALPTSSGSHHFVTNRDLCTGQRSIQNIPIFYK